MRPFVLAVRTMLLAGLLLLAGIGSSTAKNCNFDIVDAADVTWVGGSGVGYQTFDPQQYTLAVDFRVQAKSNGCSFFVTVSSTTSLFNPQLAGSREALRYQIYADASRSSILGDLPGINFSQVLLAPTSEDHKTYPFRFYLSVPALQIVGPDTFSDKLAIKVYDGSLFDASLDEQRTIQFKATVPETTELSLDSGTWSSVSTTSTMDFGTMQTGSTRSLTFYARGNAGYRFAIQSQNGGVLRPIGGSGDKDDSVSYSLSINNVPVLLQGGGPTTVPGAAAATTAQGIPYRAIVTVGDVSLASPGDYKDVVQFTLTSQR